MKKTIKIIGVLAFFGFLVFVAIKLLNAFGKSIMEDKPNGPFHSCESIIESKINNVWLTTYFADSSVVFSKNKKESFSIGEVWIEKNINSEIDYPELEGFDNILVVSFNYTTENDLHRFRLIPNPSVRLDEYVDFDKVEYPDDYPRLRFPINGIPDSLLIEVRERNTKDSLAWMTEKVVDTICFYNFSSLLNVHK